jgi:hypothetical protein
MSLIGSKSGSPSAHEPSESRLPTTCPVIGLMQAGSTMRLTKLGTACARIACLSAIDDELSIMNRRSIFDTLFCLTAENVYVGGTAASVARQVPSPCVLQASTDRESRARSRAIRLPTVRRHYKSILPAAKKPVNTP